jgi:DNA-binding beta-propeller fold protein YncE
MPGLLIRSVMVICIALMLDSCAPSERKAEDSVPLVWPPAPAAARIAFIGSFSRPEDLGITRGLFRRISDFLTGESDAKLVRPMAVVRSSGFLFVADPGAKGVHRFHPAGGRYDLVRGANDSPLPSPVGLALGANGDVYVTDSVLAGVFVIKSGTASAVPVALRQPLRQPTGIAYDAVAGRLFVVDTGAHRVFVFNPDGTLHSSFGERGAGNGEFNYPTLLWRTQQGRLYLNDSLNFRVQILDEDGHFMGKFGRVGDGSGDLARHKGIATDRSGHVYVVDALFHAIQIFDESGGFLLSVGSMGQNRGEFWLPTGIFISDDDTIYVADSYNQRVQMFRYVGGPL